MWQSGGGGRWIRLWLLARGNQWRWEIVLGRMNQLTISMDDGWRGDGDGVQVVCSYKTTQQEQSNGDGM